MSQAYSNPKRENDPHALPDIEVFHIGERERADLCEMNGEIHTQQPSTRIPCEDCPESGWYWWPCSPGCLPDGDAIGPFETEAEALADAQENACDDDDDDEPEANLTMRPDNRFEQLDRAALQDALLALRTCPHCRRDLQPVALCGDVWGCTGQGYPGHAPETWYLPKENHD